MNDPLLTEDEALFHLGSDDYAIGRFCGEATWGLTRKIGGGLYHRIPDDVFASMVKAGWVYQQDPPFCGAGLTHEGRREAACRRYGLIRKP